MQRAARAAAVASATLLTSVVTVAAAAEKGYDTDEVAVALTWTPGQARCQVQFGKYLTTVLPQVLAAFAVGDIDYRRAWLFYDLLATVDDTLAAAIAATLLPDAGEWTTSQLRARIRKAVLKADPGGAAQRTSKKLGSRSIGTTPDEDGTSSLYGILLPAARVSAAFERVDAFARGIKLTGDARTLEQLRADTFLDLLEGVGIGASPIHRAGVIELVVPWDTATGAGTEPATLAGYGPVSADIARQILASQAAVAQWQFSAVGPGGELLAHGLLGARPTPAAAGMDEPGAPDEPGGRGGSPRPTQPCGDRAPTAPSAAEPSPQPACAPRQRTSEIRPMPPVEADPNRRRPGAALTRWIRARDRTCRAPGCNRRARYADLDHTIPHAKGGKTAHDNLAVLCRHHHRLKDETKWVVTQPTPGHLIWKSPTGHIYETDPEPPSF